MFFSFFLSFSLSFFFHLFFLSSFSSLIYFILLLSQLISSCPPFILSSLHPFFLSSFILSFFHCIFFPLSPPPSWTWKLRNRWKDKRNIGWKDNRKKAFSSPSQSLLIISSLLVSMLPSPFASLSPRDISLSLYIFPTFLYAISLYLYFLFFSMFL